MVFSVSMSDASESEEVVGCCQAEGRWKETPGPIDELFFRSSESSTTVSATSATWYPTIATNVSSSRSARLFELLIKASVEGTEMFGWRRDARKRNLPLPLFRAQKRGPSLFRWKLKRRPTASTTPSTGERQASAQRQVSAWSTLSQTTKVPTAISILASTSVSPASQCFLERKAGTDALASRAQDASRKRKQKGALRPAANAER